MTVIVSWCCLSAVQCMKCELGSLRNGLISPLCLISAIYWHFSVSCQFLAPPVSAHVGAPVGAPVSAHSRKPVADLRSITTVLL